MTPKCTGIENLHHHRLACSRISARPRYYFEMTKWFVVVVCALALLGCAGPSVVGKWGYQVLGQTIVLDLKEDNTFTMGSSSTSAKAGTYTYEDGKVNLKFGSASEENMVLTLTDDGKHLNGSVGAISISLQRQES